jgi:hypothetical protein
MGSRRRASRFLLLAIAVCLLAAAPADPKAPASGAVVRKKVLAIYFSMRQATLVVDVETAMRRALTDGLGDRLEYSSENVDLSRLSDPAYQAADRTYLRAKYVESPPDLVIATSSSIVPFVRREPLFPDVPSHSTRPGVAGSAQWAGVVSGMDFRGTLVAAPLRNPRRSTCSSCRAAPGDRRIASSSWSKAAISSAADASRHHRPEPTEVEDARGCPRLDRLLSLIGDDTGRTYLRWVGRSRQRGVSAPVYGWHEGSSATASSADGCTRRSTTRKRRASPCVINGERPGTIGRRRQRRA